MVIVRRYCLATSKQVFGNALQFSVTLMIWNGRKIRVAQSTSTRQKLNELSNSFHCWNTQPVSSTATRSCWTHGSNSSSGTFTDGIDVKTERDVSETSTTKSAGRTVRLRLQPDLATWNSPFRVRPGRKFTASRPSEHNQNLCGKRPTECGADPHSSRAEYR